MTVEYDYTIEQPDRFKNTTANLKCIREIYFPIKMNNLNLN